MQMLKEQDPRQIGPYRLLGRLGSGGMGEVFLARSAGGRTVAVKVVREELAAKDAFRRRFRREVEAARKVGGDWTARVLDADTEAESPWIATAFVPGPGLDAIVEQEHGPLPERTVLVLAGRLARALTAIHAAGLVHRDLKPSNVLLTLDGPRVIDFGIARDVALGNELTRTGYAVGSPGFMSPEQVRGETVGPASDVFGLGVLLAYAATGRRPFGSSEIGPHAQMFRIVSEEPDLAGVEGELLALVTGCLHKEPEERLPLPEIVQRTAAAAEAAGEWLPASLVGHLGRAAVRLLDTDLPETAGSVAATEDVAESATEGAESATEGATGSVPTAGSTAAPAPSTVSHRADQGTVALRPETRATPPAAPPVPAEATPVPAEQTPVPAGATPAPAGTPPKRRRRLALPLLVAAVLALTAGGFVLVPDLLDGQDGKGSSGDRRSASSGTVPRGGGADPTADASKSPEPSQSSQGQDGKDSPAKKGKEGTSSAGPSPSTGKNGDGTADEPGQDGTDEPDRGADKGFPAGYPGTWENRSTDYEWTFTIPYQPADKSVTWGVSATADGSYCTFEAEVEEVSSTRLTLGKARLTDRMDNGAELPCTAGDRPYFYVVSEDQLVFYGTGQNGMFTERAA
ncbi:serine/threonine-protein kinase [Streptomyces indicus]|uniref:Serine/threonine protein kinase n=1 Tax=Streptomyces indicus TaxID=417292 RepID=A0A1G9FG55_9ACTN|nr:serine/threonine-protein kinase [Streptomyces indicus]SDK87368.1 Serine/threonine protein kinase [Streptomyces indicus]